MHALFMSMNNVLRTYKVEIIHHELVIIVAITVKPDLYHPRFCN